MEITLSRTIDYGDVDSRFKLKLGSFFKLLQESAVVHSEKVGLDSQTLIESGAVWILNLIEAEIYRYPELREPITVTTWHKQSRGFKAFRDFDVHAGRERLAAAATRWLYFDINRKRLIRVPAETGRVYTCENKSALDGVFESWKPGNDFTPGFETGISVRRSDFDPLGHVNNAVYFDYLETAITRAFGGHCRVIWLKIEFKKEISEAIETVTVGLETTESGCRFELSDDRNLFAAGEVNLTKRME